MDKRRLAIRSAVPALIAIAIVLIYVCRLFYLQVFSQEYKAKALRNALYEQVIFPDRGVIYDREGRLLVYNEPAYDLLLTTNEAKEIDTLRLCQLLTTTPEEITRRLELLKDRSVNPSYSRFTPQLFWSQLSSQEAGYIQEQLFHLPGFSLRPRAIRRSDLPYGALLLGYLGESNADELAADSTLVVGQYIGKNGVERTYDRVLRGENGVEYFLRDARGRIQGSYDNGSLDRPAVPGADLTLCIDIELQRLGEELMRGKRGAIVMIEPATGEILCLVSAPSFDTRLLQGRDLGRNHHHLSLIPGKPLLNRAIMGTYPPGSTFKMGMGALMLEEGLVTTSTRLTCNHGYPRLGNRPACHGHPSPIALRAAIATSCNAYFSWGLHFLLDDRSRYPSVQVAFDRWKDYMVSFGFGYPLGIDLPGEKRGYIPNSSVYDKIYNRWTSSTVISIAIGQGEILLTPLQMANLAALIANRGHYFTPHVVRDIKPQGELTPPCERHDSYVKPANWEEIVLGMNGAVTGGTCRVANFAPGRINVCGKTGTSQNASGADHSAFIGFAPKEHPEVAIAVYVEHGGFGATNAVPIGRVMMEYYLNHGVLSAEGNFLLQQLKSRVISYPPEK